MYGIGRFWYRDARDLVLRMAARVAHRGPDDHGAWVDAEAGLAFSHLCQSIVEHLLCVAGPLAPEPMRSVWASHLDGSANRQYPPRNVLMLQARQREQQRESAA